MIRHGYLTYPSVNLSLQTWQPTNQTLNTFIIATLATILSYQLAAILFDLLLGLKPAGQTTASDISILLLTEDSSMFNLLANLHISPALSRWKFHGLRASHHHHCQPSAPHRSYVRRLVKIDYPDVTPVASNLAPATWLGRRFRLPLLFATMLKLFILLLAAPLSNLVSIILTVESDTHFTFNDVSFGGVNFALHTNDSRSAPIPAVHRVNCPEYADKLSVYETRVSTFYYCARHSTSSSAADHLYLNGLLRMSFGENLAGAELPREAITLQFDNGENLVTISVFADLHVGNGGGVWRVKTNVTNFVQLEALFRRGTTAFMKNCEKKEFEKLANETSLPSKSIAEDGKRWKFEWSVNCSYLMEDALQLMEEELLKFTLVDSDKLWVVDTARDGKGQVDGGGFIFVERRRCFMTIGVLGISAVVVVVLRMLIRALTRNDIHLGIEMLLKDTLYLRKCDSMLQNGRSVDYTDKVFEGSIGLEGAGHEGKGGTVDRDDGTGQTTSSSTL